MSPPSDPYVAGLQLLARRELSVAQLRGKLRQRSFPDTEIERALLRLQGERALDDARTALERESWYAEKRYPTPFGEQTKCERDQRLLARADAHLADRDAIVRLARETPGREGQLLRKHAEVLAQRVTDKRIDGMRAEVRGRLERYHGLVHAVSRLAGDAALRRRLADQGAKTVKKFANQQMFEQTERVLVKAVR